MSEAIAIIGILSGAVVAVLVPYINARLERSRLEQQSRDARLDELRAILDTAVKDFYEAYSLLIDIERELNRSERSSERAQQLGDALLEAVDAIVQDGLRIELRTPQNAAIREKHRSAEVIFTGYEAAYRAYLLGAGGYAEGSEIPPTKLAGEHVAAFMDEARAFVGVVTPPPLAARSNAT